MLTAIRSFNPGPKKMLSVTCPQCSKTMKAPENLAGKKGKCSNCGGTFVIQQSQPVAIDFQSLDEPRRPTTFVPDSPRQSEPMEPDAGWYYAQGGQRSGPVSTIRLRQMASAGALQPNDLVWKQGLADWISAREVDGLFDRSLPPPLPISAAPAHPGFASPDAFHRPVYANSPPVAVTPELWNPGAAGMWSLIFSWAFGSLLVALNWRALGESERAKRGMLWFYGGLVFLGVNLFRPNTIEFFFIMSTVNLVLLLTWNFVECEPQRKLLKRLFANRYQRRGWLAPIVLSIACLFFLGMMAAGLSEATRSIH
jgi:hypothetical protein